MNEDKESSNDKVTMLNVVQSTLAAAIGVQSEKNRQRDFKKGKPITYILSGIIFVVVFISVIVAIVQLVLSSAAGH